MRSWIRPITVGLSIVTLISFALEYIMIRGEKQVAPGVSAAALPIKIYADGEKQKHWAIKVLREHGMQGEWLPEDDQSDQFLQIKVHNGLIITFLEVNFRRRVNFTHEGEECSCMATLWHFVHVGTFHKNQALRDGLNRFLMDYGASREFTTPNPAPWGSPMDNPEPDWQLCRAD